MQAAQWEIFIAQFAFSMSDCPFDAGPAIRLAQARLRIDFSLENFLMQGGAVAACIDGDGRA
jgi:hypothetical protein